MPIRFPSSFSRAIGAKACGCLSGQHCHCTLISAWLSSFQLTAASLGMVKFSLSRQNWYEPSLACFLLGWNPTRIGPLFKQLSSVRSLRYFVTSLPMDSGPVGNDLSGSLLLRPHSQSTSGRSLSLISRYHSESKVPKREAHIASARRTAPIGTRCS